MNNGISQNGQRHITEWTTAYHRMDNGISQNGQRHITEWTTAYHRMDNGISQNGQRHITDGQRHITDGQRHITDGQRHITDGQRHITDGQRHITDEFSFSFSYEANPLQTDLKCLHTLITSEPDYFFTHDLHTIYTLLHTIDIDGTKGVVNQQQITKSNDEHENTTQNI